MFNNSNIYSEGWCSSVFANRNQAYGAYDLRKVSDRNIFAGLLLTTSMVLSISLYFTFKNHGVPTPPDIASTLLTQKTDTFAIIEMHLEDKPQVKEAPPAATADPEPQKPEVTSTPSDNAPVQIVSNETEIVKAPTTNEVASQATTSTNGTTSTTSTNTGVAGNDVESGTTVESENQVRTYVQNMPEFPGGTAALMKYIRNNVSYPEVAREMEKEGIVYVSFVVERNGEVSNVHVEKSVYKALDNEAMRVVKNLPKWKPGSQNGQTVRVQFTVPIRFLLSV